MTPRLPLTNSQELTMLVLKRLPSESITLTHPDGTVMTVRVVRVEGRRVTLAVAGPREVAVGRGDDRPSARPAIIAPAAG